ncbi:MAG: hypothetical protein M1827_002065 [Pycnora praestabilis]|nr:MAG: hypothetical protein M1827_002065 [Pycnora praestabilis]
MSDKLEKPLNELLSNTMVDIYVGQDNTRWHLHEKLLCYHSQYFAKIFYNGDSKHSQTKQFGLPDEDDASWQLFVGWLYSRAVRIPDDEKDIGPLLDLALMADKWSIEKLATDVMDAVRTFYHTHETYPGLRRVQYVYGNTEPSSPMRQMMVDSVARYLAISPEIPEYWDKALRHNAELAVDVIRAIHDWHLPSQEIPDARDGSSDARSMKTEENGE